MWRSSRKGWGESCSSWARWNLSDPSSGHCTGFVTIHPRNSVRKVAPCVSFILRHLTQLVQSRHYSCAVELVEQQELTHKPVARERRSLDGTHTWTRMDVSPWCALEILEKDWPWVYAKGQKASLVLSTLEALAALVALTLQHNETPFTHQTKVLIAPSLTDNRGERCCTEQADENEISRVRSAHGTCHVHEEDESADGCRVGAERGAIGKRTSFRTDSTTTSTRNSGHQFRLRASRGVFCGRHWQRAVRQNWISRDKGWSRPPKPLQKGEETATRRAPPHCRPLVTARKSIAHLVHLWISQSLFVSSLRSIARLCLLPFLPLVSVVCLGTTLMWYFDLVVVVGWTWFFVVWDGKFVLLWLFVFDCVSSFFFTFSSSRQSPHQLGEEFPFARQTPEKFLATHQSGEEFLTAHRSAEQLLTARRACDGLLVGFCSSADAPSLSHTTGIGPVRVLTRLVQVHLLDCTFSLFLL